MTWQNPSNTTDPGTGCFPCATETMSMHVERLRTTNNYLWLMATRRVWKNCVLMKSIARQESSYLCHTASTVSEMKCRNMHSNIVQNQLDWPKARQLKKTIKQDKTVLSKPLAKRFKYSCSLWNRENKQLLLNCTHGDLFPQSERVITNHPPPSNPVPSVKSLVTSLPLARHKKTQNWRNS